MVRQGAIDALKVMLAVLVIVIHTKPFSDGPLWLESVIQQGFCRVAVPAFFVMSGFYLAPHLGSGGFNRWAQRLLLLYAVWMVIYSPWWLREIARSDLPVYQSIISLVLGHHHLWYLAASLLGGWLLMQLHRRAPRALLPVIFLALGIGLSLQIILAPYLDPATGYHSAWILHLYRNGLTMAFPFMALGTIMRLRQWDQRCPGPVALMLAVLGTTLLLGQAWLSSRYGNAITPIDQPVGAVLTAPALVILALKMPAMSFPASMGTFALGLYLVHPVAISLLSKIVQGPALFLGVAVAAAIGTWGLLILRRRWPWLV